MLSQCNIRDNNSLNEGIDDFLGREKTFVVATSDGSRKEAKGLRYELKGVRKGKMSGSGAYRIVANTGQFVVSHQVPNSLNKCLNYCHVLKLLRVQFNEELKRLRSRVRFQRKPYLSNFQNACFDLGWRGRRRVIWLKKDKFSDSTFGKI